MKSGELSRAARVLTSVLMAPSNKETAEKLAAKHPARRDQWISSPSLPNEETFNLSKYQLFEAVRKSPNGSDSGFSGWRYEHLRVLIDNPLTADLL